MIEKLTELFKLYFLDFSVVCQEGSRKVKRIIKHYNLDAVISIGYRVSSYKAIKFRQWSTSVLKKYISNGYAINTHKITEQRLTNLENYMQFVKSNIKSDTLEIKNSEKFYDRFLIIDQKQAYHIGASLKYLGKKIFGFSKIDVDLILQKVLKIEGI